MKIWNIYRLRLLVVLCAIFIQELWAQDIIRLAPNPHTHPLRGRLEVWHDGKWGTVCKNDGWGIEEANVVCRQLGAPDPFALYTRSTNNDESQGGWGKEIWIANVHCNGDEQSLTQCRYQLDVPTNNCNGDHNYDVVVVCSLPGYLGCYRNLPDPGPDSWIQHVSTQSSLTIETCLSVCRQRSFSIGMLYDMNCWCGDNDASFGGAEKVATEECDIPCSGSIKQHCGGGDEDDKRASLYLANLGGALGEPNLVNPTSGSIASPFFPGLYTTSMQWNLDFSYLVGLDIRIPFLHLATGDSLVFRNELTGETSIRLPGDLAQNEFANFIVGPVRQLDIVLSVEGSNSAYGFILFYEVVPAPVRTTTTIPPPPPTTKTTTTRPPPPPTPIVTNPPPPQTTRRPPPPEPTTKATTTTKPPPRPTTRPRPTTKPRPTTTETTTTRRVPPPPQQTTKETPTTKKPTTTKRATQPPVRTTRQRPTTTERTTKSRTTELSKEDRRRRFVITWWFEVWTFICVAVFVVAMVLISLICWKSREWEWLKQPRRRHHVIHRRYSSHSSWSDFYNFKHDDGIPVDHKHRRGSDHSDCSSSDEEGHRGRHHRRHRRHDSHSSWSSSWAPTTSHRSIPSSVAHSSSSGYGPHGSTQYLIDPKHSYPGVTYHDQHGQGHVAYPISGPHEDDDAPSDPISRASSKVSIVVDTIIPQEEIHYPCPDDHVVAEEALPLGSRPSQHSSTPTQQSGSLYNISKASSKVSIEVVTTNPPPAPPPPPPPGGDAQIDPPSLQLDAGPSSDIPDPPRPPPPPPPPPQNQSVVIVAEVETNVVEANVEDGDAENGKSKKKKKKKDKKNKKSKHKGDAGSSSTSEQPLEPVDVVIDNCTPPVWPERPPEPLPSAHANNEDLIIPEVEPYIMADGGEPLYSKPDKKSKKSGKSKTKKKKKGRGDNAIGEDEIEAVISGLDQSIRQLERDHHYSITDLSITSGIPAADDVFGDPTYGSGNPSSGYRQGHVRIPSEVSAMNPSIALPDVGEAPFVVVQAANGNRVDFIPSSSHLAPRRDFIIPGEGTDDLPEDLDMFGN